MLTAELLTTTFEAAARYDDYVATGTDAQQEAWAEVYERGVLTDAQRALAAGFPRDMKVLISSGVWCGDCVQQCPLLQRIAETSDRVELRLVDRDAHPELASQVQICGGLRVPVTVFMAEDFEPIGVFGDRTLTRYRAMAARQLGASCPVPGAPLDEDELRGTLADWLDEFERMQLLLRLSTRLRQRHGD
ncbi:MAG: thioredoxin family protein [Planctomycetota bacterium]